MKKFIKNILIVGVLVCSLFCFGDTVRATADKKPIVIVIDPGHGGEDPGTIGTTGVYESKCNYAIALAMKNELCKYSNVKVYLTREEDSWTTNTGRAMIAADLKADFLISIHNNGGSETNSGAIAFRTLNSYYSEQTNDMCTLILDNLATLGFKNGGVQTRVSTSYDYEDYYTIIGEGVRAGVPSIIVEHCFLSNPNDAALISNPDGSLKQDMLTQMGIADAKAVVSYFKLTLNEAVAEENSQVELEKGYGFKVSTPDGNTNGVTWFSTSQSVATVDNEGNVMAVGAGNANITYKLADGTQGSCTVSVKEPKAMVLTGFIDPTFYPTRAEFAALNTLGANANIVYSDGSVSKVSATVTGTINYDKIGIQDIDIKYENLTGKLRVCHNPPEYVPTVTMPVEEVTEAPTETDTTEEVTTAAPSEKKPSQFGSFIKEFGKYIIIVGILLALGIVFVFIEKKKRKRYKNRSRKIL